MGADQWADVGMFMQNVMLLAREHGLQSLCPRGLGIVAQFGERVSCARTCAQAFLRNDYWLPP
jgi:hypothetical protein